MGREGRNEFRNSLRQTLTESKSAKYIAHVDIRFSSLDTIDCADTRFIET